MTDVTDAERLWFRLLRLQTRMNGVIGERLRDIGLSVPQCDVLTTLTEQEGMSQQDLARRLYVTKGNISGLIDRLEAAGLVERRDTPEDRRSRAVHLTDDGRRLAQQGIEVQKSFVAETFARMPAERLDAFERLIIEARDLVRAAGNATWPLRDPETRSRLSSASQPRVRARSA